MDVGNAGDDGGQGAAKSALLCIDVLSIPGQIFVGGRQKRER